jgi:KDO2-lipid IV(A) lauroyltransferase
VTATAADSPPPPPARRPFLRHRIEFAAWRAFELVLSVLPLELGRAIGAFIGRVGYFPLGIRRRVVDHNLRAAFPASPDRERRRIASGSYASLGRVAIEAAMLSRMKPAEVLGLFHPPVGWEHVERIVAGGRGAFLIGGHLGNWEVGFSYFAARGLRISPVGRQMRNPLFDETVRETRAKSGLTMLGDFDFVKHAPRRLAEGHFIGVLADQGAKSMTGVFVPFFGRLARTPKAPAVMALRLRADCLFIAMPREADGKFRVYIEPIPVTATGDRERDVEALVTTYASMLEKFVRRYPDQYLWQHRRWRRRPDGTLEDV